MKKSVFNDFKEKIVYKYLDDEEEVIEVLENYANAYSHKFRGNKDVTPAICRLFVEDGNLAIYDDDMFNELHEVYGLNFRPETYERLDGKWRYVGGKTKIFVTYVALLSTVLYNIYEQYKKKHKR